MIGLDTNVLARLVVKDDPAQTELAQQFVARRCTVIDPGLVNNVVLCELVWVLTRGYGFGRTEIVELVEDLLTSRDIVLEDEQAVRAAFRNVKIHRIDFADALIGAINGARGCEATATFDRRAARIDGFILAS